MTAHPARFWLGLLAAFVLALWLLRHILLPFVLGMAVGYLLDPLVRDRGRRPMRAKDKGTGRRKSRKISERSWKFRAAADEGNARTLIAVNDRAGFLGSPARRFTIAALKPPPDVDGQLDLRPITPHGAWPAC